MFLIPHLRYVVTMQLTFPVHTRPSLPVPPHNIHLSFTPRSRPLPIQTRRPHRRPRTRTRLARRSPRARHRRHRKNLLVNARITTKHPSRSSHLRRWSEYCHKRHGHYRGQDTVDTLHTADWFGWKSRRDHDHHGGQRGSYKQSIKSKQHV